MRVPTKLARKDIATLLMCLATVLVPLGARSRAGEPEWQKNAVWCVADSGPSGRSYRSVCRKAEQYDAILACQSHNRGARETIVQAGRDAVNAFMADKKPGECR
jgi:hypothetical protein